MFRNCSRSFRTKLLVSSILPIRQNYVLDFLPKDSEIRSAACSEYSSMEYISSGTAGHRHKDIPEWLTERQKALLLTCLILSKMLLLIPEEMQTGLENFTLDLNQICCHTANQVSVLCLAKVVSTWKESCSLHAKQILV